MKLLVWNLEWARPQAARGREILERIRSADPDVCCLTELTTGMFPAGGHAIIAEGSSGYPGPSERKKVALWSRHPWLAVDPVGSRDLPGGRFVSGISSGVRFVGVCVPWHASHVNTGRRDRKLWEDHLTYLEELKGLLAGYLAGDVPVCLLGDFNQRVPIGWQPPEIYDALVTMLKGGFELRTAGIPDEAGDLLIDHVATGPGLHFSADTIVPKSGNAGNKLSDHSGIVGRLAKAC